MNFKDDELHIIKLISNGYVIPITQHNQEIIDKIVKSSFLLEKKNVKLIKNYSIDLNDIFCATLDTRFEAAYASQEI